MKATSMTRLLNKIERRLGTEVLNLPDHLSKNKWAEVISDDSLTTFSRFFPHQLLYRIDTQEDKGRLPGEYFIDEDKLGPDVSIYGIRDLTMENLAKITDINNGGYTSMYGNFEYADVMMSQMNADVNSIFNTGTFLEFEYPNKITIQGCTHTDILQHLPFIELYVFVKHADNLNTISPTKMEYFEKLAIIDIKMFLYNGLKHFDGLETVYANIDLKIQDWGNAEADRETLIQEFQDKYVSPANTNQPMMYTI